MLCPQYSATDSFTPHLIYVLTTKSHLIREASSSNQSCISAISVLSPLPDTQLADDKHGYVQRFRHPPNGSRGRRE